MSTVFRPRILASTSYSFRFLHWVTAYFAHLSGISIACPFRIFLAFNILQFILLSAVTVPGELESCLKHLVALGLDIGVPYLCLPDPHSIQNNLAKKIILGLGRLKAGVEGARRGWKGGTSDRSDGSEQ